MRLDETKNQAPVPCLYLIPIKLLKETYTGCVIIIDAFLSRSPARTVIGSQTVEC